MADKKIRVLVWNEYRHERTDPQVKEIYPDGIHACIAEFLGKEADIEVRTAVLDDPNNGLSDELLSKTDVLIWWAHIAHQEVLDENVKLIQKHVQSGMGFIGLHSAHMSKPMTTLLGTPCTLRWRDNDSEILWCVNPDHPIAKGVPARIVIPHEEMYGEFFNIPKPDDLIFIGNFKGGEVFRSGVTFTRGYGRIFYLQTGHEEFPIYHMPEIQQILKNAVRWAAEPERRENAFDCFHVDPDGNILGLTR